MKDVKQTRLRVGQSVLAVEYLYYTYIMRRDIETERMLSQCSRGSAV